MVSQPLDPDYDDRDWTRVAAGAALDLDAVGVHYGHAWYRARLTGRPSHLLLDARHCWAAYLNGHFLQAGDNHRNRLGTGDDMALTMRVKLPAEYYRPGENVLTVLVESLGHNKGFLEDLKNPRGIVYAAAGREDLEWRVRGGLVPGESGMTPRVDFSRVPITAAEEVQLPHSWPEGLHGVGLYQTSFTLNLETADSPPLGLFLFTAQEKANLYLNCWLVGRYWESAGPQKVFYLPSGLLNLQGDNQLAVTLWRWREPARISKMHVTMYP
jgi:hypothetical protein